MWMSQRHVLIPFPDISVGLRDVRVVIPAAVKRGDNALLICNYDMEDDSLYSIKWYKGRREFYRYTPKEPQSIKTFPVAGISVEVSFSIVCKINGRKNSHAVSTPWYKHHPKTSSEDSGFAHILENEYFDILSFQTTLSNASQVVISQVETNISGKFSCEGNVMCVFAISVQLNSIERPRCLRADSVNCDRSDGRSLPHPFFGVLLNIIAFPEKSQCREISSCRDFLSFLAQFLPMRRISIRCSCLATCKSLVSRNSLG